MLALWAFQSTQSFATAALCPRREAVTLAPMKVVIVAFEGITQLDFTGPAQVFSRLPNASIDLVAARRTPIPTGCGFDVVPSKTFQDCPQADLLCVPGGLGVVDAIADPGLVDFIARQAAGARYVTSVCTGSLLLGAAGLLDGRRATTHWAYTSLLGEFGATYVPGRVVVDGHLITGGGVTAGLDFAFRVAAEVVDQPTARRLQLALEYDPEPPFDAGHPDRSPPELVEAVRARYAEQVERVRTFWAARRSP